MPGPPLDDQFDPYAELQLSPGAEPELVKAAFKALAKKYHPDRFTDPAEKARAEARMARINEAQRMLQSGYQPRERRDVAATTTPVTAEPTSAPARPRPAEPPTPPPSPSIRKGPFAAAALLLLALLLLPLLFTQSHLEKALQAEREGRLRDSLVLLNRAVEASPHDRELYRHRARIFTKLGEPEKAGVDLRNARVPELDLSRLTATPDARTSGGETP